jgi:hypothetical protein
VSIRAEFDIQGLDGVLATLQALPAEVVSKRGGPVRASLAKGARYLRDAEKAALERLIGQGGDPEERTGLLLQNIVASRGKAPTGSKGERQIVRIRRKTYPRPTKGKPVTTIKVAQIFEYGAPGNNQPARSFIRSTFEQERGRVLQMIVQDLPKRIEAITRKLARQNAARGR